MENCKEDANATDLKPKYRGIKALPFVIGNETFEKLGTIGTTTNLLIYLTTVFNMTSLGATNFVNIFNGSANIATLIGAFLSDTYFGRYNALGFSSVASFLGMLGITLTAAIPGLHPPDCGGGSSCTGATPGQYLFLIGAFAMLVIGAGGIRPCNLAFGADQFDPDTESGRRGISSFFNWYYLTFTFAMMVSLTFIVYIQASVSWTIGLAIPAVMMFLSTSVFFLGTKIYVRVQPEGSPLVGVVQVLVAAVKKRHLELLPHHSTQSLFNHIPSKTINSILRHSDQFRFLDKAAIRTEEDKINSDGTAANPWRLASLQRVEEVKCIIRVIPVWVSGVIYYIAVVLMQQNFVVFQALQVRRHIGRFQIPAATLIIFAMMAMTLWIPVYDQIVVPALRKITGKEGGITMLQRVGVGQVISLLTMILSAVVEQWRRKLALESGQKVSPMSWAWLVPQLAMAGLSEAFAIIGLIEFYYKQVPENMRSIGGAFFFCGVAISTYLGSFILSLVDKVTRRAASGSWVPQDLNKGRLDYFYYMIAGLEMANLVYFFACSKWYRYKGSEDGILETKEDV